MQATATMRGANRESWPLPLEKSASLFSTASAPRENSYENTGQAFGVAESLDDMEVLLAKLRPMLAQSRSFTEGK